MLRASEFSELRAFSVVAQERSFRRAASRLLVSPSSLSHLIRALEDRLGAKLLHRTTRSVSLTEAGSVLLSAVLPAIAQIEGAIGEVGAFSDQPRGRLRINLPRIAADMIIAPKLAEFTARYRDVALDLVVEDSLADIVAGGFDAGIRPGERVHGDMIAVRLTPDSRVAVVASPEYLASVAPPVSPQDLHQHRCINYRWAHNQTSYRWQFGRGDRTIDVDLNSAITVNDTGLIISAALGGAGFAYVLEDAVTEHLKDGRLVKVLEDWCQPASGFYLYYSGRRNLSAPLRAMIQFFRHSGGSAGEA